MMPNRSRSLLSLLSLPLVLLALVLLHGCGSSQPVAGDPAAPKYEFMHIEATDKPATVALIREIAAQVRQAGVDFQVVDAKDSDDKRIQVQVSHQESDQQSIISVTLMYADNDQRGVEFGHHGRLTPELIRRFARDVIALMKN